MARRAGSPTTEEETLTDFPIAYRSFHPDPGLNYELNRWRAALPEEEIESLLRASDRSVTGAV